MEGIRAKGLLSLPDEILTDIKNKALVPENNASKYYLDLTYSNPNISSPAKVKNTLTNIRFLNPIENPNTNALEDLYRITRHINTFRGEVGQGVERQNQKRRFIDNANIIRDEHNATNHFRLVENMRIARLFNDTFGGDLYDEQSWGNVYENLIKPTRINFSGNEIQYSTPLTNKSASKIQATIKRRII